MKGCDHYCSNRLIPSVKIAMNEREKDSFVQNIRLELAAMEPVWLRKPLS